MSPGILMPKNRRLVALNELPIAPLLEYFGGDVPQVEEGGRWRKMRCPFP
jgi:hypothetical protein